MKKNHSLDLWYAVKRAIRFSNTDCESEMKIVKRRSQKIKIVLVT